MPDELIYKTYTQAEEAPTPAADGELSQLLIDTLGGVVSEERALRRREVEQELAPLRRELLELRAKLDVLLTLLQGKAADVVSLARKHA